MNDSDKGAADERYALIAWLRDPALNNCTHADCISKYLDIADQIEQLPTDMRERYPRKEES